MLEILKYEKENDLHSCGAYVLSFILDSACTTAFIPMQTQKTMYDEGEMEKDRWACIAKK